MQKTNVVPPDYNDSKYDNVTFVGFWAKTQDHNVTGLPFPKSDAKGEIDKQFLENLKYTEKFSLVADYMGMSQCRVCGCMNGCSEYKSEHVNNSNNTITYLWPEGYKHYITEHNVAPDPQFVKFINTVGPAYKERYENISSYIPPICDTNGQIVQYYTCSNLNLRRIFDGMAGIAYST
jgi:hypothetical protein